MTDTTQNRDDQKQALSRVVRAWDRRLRLQQAVRWFARSLIPGLALGIGLAVYSRFQPFLLSEQIVNVTAAGVAAGIVALLIGVTFYPRSMTRAAQKFDVMFGLNERVSTALELIGGKIRSTEMFTDRQLSDAVQRVQNVRAQDVLPLYMRWQDWAGVAVLVGILATLLLIPNPMEDTVRAAAESNAAIEESADDLREIQEDIAADPTLNEDERQQLLEELDRSIDTLEQPDITTEEAFAELSEVESELQQRANTLAEQLEAQRRAMASAQSAMQNAMPNTQSAEGSEGDGRSLEDMLRELEDQLDGDTSDEQRESLSDALRDAAEALEGTNPNAAQNLQDAAENLQQGDNSQAQQDLQEGQQNLQQGQQQQSQQQQSQQNLQQGANQAQQSQQNLQQGQQQQGQQQQGQQGQQQQGQSGQGQQQQGQQQQGQQGQGQQQQGQQSGQQQPGQGQGEQSGQQPGPQGQGQGQSQQGQSGQQSQSGQQGQQSGATQGGNNAAGAGDGEGDGGDQGGFAGDSSEPMDTNNSPDGEGEDEFESIYAPQRLGGEGDDSVTLESGDENQPLVEGDFSENPTGDVSVPYNEVFSDYSDAANQALERDYVPLGMEDVVRDYFTSIEPGQ